MMDLDGIWGGAVVLPATIALAVVVASKTQLGRTVLFVYGSTLPFRSIAAHLV